MEDGIRQNSLIGYSLASAMSATMNTSSRCEQLVKDNFPKSSHRRVYTVPSSSPPPLEETLPASLIKWPVIEENA